MKNYSIIFCLVGLLALGFHSPDQGRELNAPPPEQARTLVKRGIELRERDRFQEAAAAFKEALSVAPQYLDAHVEYIRTKTYCLERYDEVRTEYDALIAKQPENPVYLMALLNGQSLTYYTQERAWLEKVAKLAPEWAWGHYAKASLLLRGNQEQAVTEWLKCLEAEPTALGAYSSLIRLAERSGKMEDALRTAERMLTQPELRASGLGELWRLQLAKAQASDEAKAALRDTLQRLTASSSEIATLVAVHSADTNLLKDSEGARRVEEKLRRLDPAWYPGRGQMTVAFVSNETEIPSEMVLANRQYELYSKLGAIAGRDLTSKEKMVRLEKLFSPNLSPKMKWLTSGYIFREAEKAGDFAAMVKYGEAMHALDSTDPMLLVKIALALAELKKEFPKAERYARLAEEVTSQFRRAARPANTDANWFESSFPERRQQEKYKPQRALALDTLGWVLSRMGKYREAETKLRQSIEMGRSEKNLSHLAAVLDQLNRHDEARSVALEAEREWLEVVKRELKSGELAPDFSLTGIDGRAYRLSALKGKVVWINFWATWCGPCVQEMPDLGRLYQQYRERGVEILAISVDSQDDRDKVAPLAAQYKLGFPVLFDEGAAKLFNVQSYPTHIFIDRQGRVRYQRSGTAENPNRVFGAVINELLK